MTRDPNLIRRDDAPERIGIISDGMGCWALAHRDEADHAVHYIRADLATPAPVVPAEGLDALQRRAYSWQVEHEQGPDTFRDVRNNPAHAHEMLESAHVLIDDLASALRSAPPVGARVSIPSGLIDALRSQRQIDADWCEVAVSRQACDEAAAILAAILPAEGGE